MMISGKGKVSAASLLSLMTALDEPSSYKPVQYFKPVFDKFQTQFFKDEAIRKAQEKRDRKAVKRLANSKVKTEG